MNTFGHIVNRRMLSLRCTAMALLISLVACVREGIETPPVIEDEPVRVEILLHAPESSGTSTRALTHEDEVRVSDVLVLFFTESDMILRDVSEGRRLMPSQGSEGSVVTFETSFTLDQSLAGAEFRCVVLANVSAWYPESQRAGWRGKNYEALQRLLWRDVTDRLHTDATASGIAMWGKATSAFVPSNAKQQLSVPLLRGVARVDVTTGVDVDNFTLNEVYIYKPNDKLSIMPQFSACGPDGRVVTAPSVPVGTAALATPWKYDVTGGRIDYSIYIPESDVVMGGDGTPGDAHHTDRCALVVGGIYDGGESMNYYRIDFKSGGRLKQVLRNHRYIINIVSVSAPGEDTPDKAYESRTAAVTAEVVDWTDDNQDIVFDGSDWVSVGRKRLDFGDGKGAVQQLRLLSSIKPSEWSLQFSSAEGTYDPKTETSVSGYYFSVTKPADRPEGTAGTEGGYLIVTTLQALPEYREDAPSVKNEVLHEKLTVRIGRLQLVIDLYQHPYSDTGWDSGGDIPRDF